jgi:hypothetical protein
MSTTMTGSSEADLILTGGWVIPMDPARQIIENGAVAIKDGRILAVGPAADIAATWTAERIIDTTGKAVLPGFIDAHAHAGHGLIKTMAMDGGDRWEEICGEVYTTGSTPEFWYAEARLAALERLRFGVTTGVSLLGGGDTIRLWQRPYRGRAGGRYPLHRRRRADPRAASAPLCQWWLGSEIRRLRHPARHVGDLAGPLARRR